MPIGDGGIKLRKLGISAARASLARPAETVSFMVSPKWLDRAWRNPPDRKPIILGASHTSNWDFPVFLGTVHAVGRRVRFIGKHSLFRGPLGRFMRSLGGLPVDRGARQDLVGQIVEQIRSHDDFLLIVAAEGTRARTTRWKTGFYQIALRAQVPIVCAGPDYRTKRGVFGPVIHPTGDYARDMAPALAFFRTLEPRHPARATFPDEPD